MFLSSSELAKWSFVGWVKAQGRELLLFFESSRVCEIALDAPLLTDRLILGESFACV